MPTEYFSFRESAAFTKRLPKYLAEDSYFALQDYLLENPDEGDVIVGGKGIRKLRWRAEGRGKRGGLRVIYYFADRHGYIYLLMLYAKNEQEDLTAQQLKELHEIVGKWL
jgi:mRNA-degrading endonuclease RelE of RelBE toxin-antitoxin system